MEPALEIEFLEVGGGALAVMHRPRLRLLPAIRAAGASHLVTLLSEREGAATLGSAARAAGLAWIWVDLPNGARPPPDRLGGIAVGVTEVRGVLGTGGRAVVHCSAGIHRTGMFTYALLRAAGSSPDEARTRLARLRAHTADGVGADRLAWAEELYAATGR